MQKSYYKYCIRIFPIFQVLVLWAWYHHEQLKCVYLRHLSVKHKVHKFRTWKVSLLHEQIRYVFSIQFSVKKFHYIHYIALIWFLILMNTFDMLLQMCLSIKSRFTGVTRVWFFCDSGFLYPNFSCMNMLNVTVQFIFSWKICQTNFTLDWMNRRHLCSSTEEKKLLDEMNHMYLFVYCSRRLTHVDHIVRYLLLFFTQEVSTESNFLKTKGTKIKSGATDSNYIWLDVIIIVYFLLLGLK